ncbi:FtsB family cell division protein [Demequina flava]|uniref:FtsB family cell division protein n=1 Tax=Demequina flava TaxID=1095025 RepID=UPI00078458BC|nr:septum formation initiator family protein [Demequina flava]
MLTWRTAVIVGVLILAFAVVAPAVRAYLDQQAMLEGLRADAEVAQAEVDDLNAEVARWDDPAYLVAQARERLYYVFPGETPYRVLDPEVIEDPALQAEAEARETAADPLRPWYDTLWESMTDGAEEAANVVESEDAETSPSADSDENERLTDVDFGG